MELTLHVRGRIGGGMVIAVHGDLDFAAVDRFRACVERALQPPPGILYLDLQLVTFIDSSGVGALVALRQQAERAATRLVLENPSDTLRHTLRTAGVLDSFDVPPA
ncbi:STAS domain-containing protein [Dactylosporangium sp. AC04546]|uniref:STAS domain-containing protein n=1 Tax=Dactylosporangium sp. AC04546 TaxID=2862460 RepID=UPI001EE1247E|nr:STAS domain-containing protein [Dactylosporangium sp. AC04546]WVK80573.1 STAS domain-containing protein [Dactylosporangium sp. AC04546]